MINAATLFLLFLIYAGLGWIVEEVEVFLRYHRWENRGFLYGPVLPIYGCGAMLAALLLQKYYNDPVVVFVLSVVLFGVLEYVTSFVMEKMFHARWWSYDDRKFNLNGRVCLETLIPFGLLGMCVVYILNPFWMGFLRGLPEVAILVAAAVLLPIFVIDNVKSFAKARENA